MLVTQLKYAKNKFHIWGYLLLGSKWGNLWDCRKKKILSRTLRSQQTPSNESFKTTLLNDEENVQIHCNNVPSSLYSTRWSYFHRNAKKMKSCIHFIAKTQHHVLRALAGENEQFMAAFHHVPFLSELTDLKWRRNIIKCGNNILVAMNWLGSLHWIKAHKYIVKQATLTMTQAWDPTWLTRRGFIII